MQTFVSFIARFISACAFACVSTSAVALPITSTAGLTGSTTRIDFSQFVGANQFEGVGGPVQIGTLAGVDVTVQDASGGANLWLYNRTWGLNVNGEWDGGRNGYLGTDPNFATLRITFHDGPVSGFGLFMNYPAAGYGDQKIRAYAGNGSLLELFDVGLDAPISTPSALNEGAFRGIQLATATIAYIELTGRYGVYDDFQFTAAAAEVPEPATLMLLGMGAVAILSARRRRQR